MNWRLVLLCLLAALPARAQPGGGGGLDILGIYGRTAGRLVRLDSATVQVRQFVLGDAAALAAYQAERPYRPAWYPVVDGTGSNDNLPRPSRRPRSLFDTYHAAVRLEVLVDWYPARYADVQLRLDNPEPQRLQLVYRGDTMVLDVSNLPHQNGAGDRAQLDSLVVMPGYFGLSFERRPVPGTMVLNQADTLGFALGFQQRQLGFVLTPRRVAGLQTARYLDYRPAGRPGLPRLPNPAILRYRALADADPQPQRALATIARAQAAGVPLDDARTCLLRARLYQQLRQPVLAEQWLTEALRLTPSLTYQNPEAGSDLGVLQTAYEQRMGLRLRGRRYSLALADYDSLAAMDLAAYRAQELPYLAEVLQTARRARLAFQTDSLHDARSYRATVSQLRADLEPNLATMWRCGLGGTGPDALDQLAKAEYQCGEFAMAYQHWQVLLLQGNLGAEQYVAYFTKLLAQHPGRPELLLCRALAYQCSSPADFNDRLSWPDRDAALRDLQQAGRLLPRDFRVNYFRAKVYEQAGQLPLAVTEMALALAKETTLPALYRFRHELRVKMHQVQEFSRNDPDYVRYSDLCTGGY
jgi:tetratricopeptide (TPR) repeat protein